MNSASHFPICSSRNQAKALYSATCFQLGTTTTEYCYYLLIRGPFCEHFEMSLNQIFGSQYQPLSLCHQYSYPQQLRLVNIWPCCYCYCLSHRFLEFQLSWENHVSHYHQPTDTFTMLSPRDLLSLRLPLFLCQHSVPVQELRGANYIQQVKPNDGLLLWPCHSSSQLPFSSFPSFYCS